MLFSRSVLLPALGLVALVASQVVVTVTNTITVVTVTVAPKTTSTSTILVTVTGTPPPTKSTSTVTVIVTAEPSTTQAATCPIAEWGQCGGEGYTGNCGKCATNAVCKYKDVWYSYCSNLPRVVNLVQTVYKPALT